jgi:DNA-binding transcriptional MerR regulator
MEQYSIRDLEKLSGIKAHTIRVWERRFGILKQHRTETNRRRYGDSELRRIINISILHRNGFKISLISKLSAQEIEEKVTFLSSDTNQYDTQIDSLTTLMIDQNEKAINDLLIRNILNRGIEETFTDLVFPFLNKIGTMWHTGSMDIGAEHFIANIFRQRIISAIDSLSTLFKQEKKKVILFLPEYELHELALLFSNYIIRKAGHETLYLGQTTPLSSVVKMNSTWNADLIITSLMSGFPAIKPLDFVSQLAKAFPQQKVLIAGMLADSSLKIKHRNVFQVKSGEDLKKHL